MVRVGMGSFIKTLPTINGEIFEYSLTSCREDATFVAGTIYLQVGDHPCAIMFTEID